MKRSTSGESADLLRSRAGQALASGDPAAAKRLIQRALIRSPARVDLMLAMGHIQLAAREYPDAVQVARKVLERAPSDVRAWNLLGQAVSFDDRTAAREMFMEALRLDPTNLETLFHLGQLDADEGAAASAVQWYERALEVAPDNQNIALSMALQLVCAGHSARAEAVLRELLSRAPDNLRAVAGLAQVLFDRFDFSEALLHYRNLVSATTEVDVTAWNNLGVCQRHIGDLQAASASFSRALERAPESPEVLANLGFVEFELRHLDRSRSLLARANERQPGRLQVLAQLLELDLLRCDWEDFSRKREHVIQAVAGRATKPGQTVNPFSFLAICDEPDLQLSAAKSFAWPEHKPGTHAVDSGKHVKARPRLGFVFISLNERPETRLLIGLLEHIDRRRFDIYAYGLQRCASDTLSNRIITSVSATVQFEPSSTDALVERIRADDIDVLFDVAGYTGQSRPDVFARRPARVQVNFVAYAGTLGASQYDFVMSDGFTTPEGEEGRFTERVLRLPDCYLPCDPDRPLATKPTRLEYGLPDNAFVFVAEAAPYKILPEVFDVWMRLLTKVPGSVLWLRHMPASTIANLRLEAGRRGVDEGRLRFAPHDDAGRYVARFGLGDLYLDTFPFGSHTTVNDALYAGLPALVLKGRSMAARASASQVLACGLDELVVDSLEEYEATAHALSLDRARLGDLRHKLASARGTSSLFDMKRYAKSFEQLIMQIS